MTRETMLSKALTSVEFYKLIRATITYDLNSSTFSAINPA